MNRIDRITAILIQLQSKRVVKAKEIADRFDISLRTVYRDIRTLELAGIPILSEAGIGYSIMNGYRLPPVMFTREEATAFLTAEKLVGNLTDRVTSEQYQSAMFKIKAVLHSAEKELLEDLGETIKVLGPPNRIPENDRNNWMPIILQHVVDKKVLSILYFTNHSQTTRQRDVEPIGVYFLSGQWHMIAYCRLREDYRDFRLDRIRQLESTRIAFKSRSVTLNDYLNREPERSGLQKVVLLFHKSALRYIQEQKYYYGFVSEEDHGDKIQMTFLSEYPQGISRWLLMFGDTAEVVSPETVKSELQCLIKQLQQHHLNA